ncbi:olfactory receptor 11A1-like [Salarias fasciatus]|uniref:olfactory receptor 11A1-like n=1 Tax=Salarias fasciatus TaxID=181472 RepID=UPI001176A71E|nr:olfactory receptor 11A1-like [Salarias fasciatus]
MIVYIILTIANAVSIVFIISDQKLHKPMYLLICNLAVVDIMFTSSVVPTIIGVLLEQWYGVVFVIILGPPFVNPFVYCLRTKEIRSKLYLLRPQPVSVHPALFAGCVFSS